MDAFLELDDREILHGPGKVSAKTATDYAKTEFEKFRLIQDISYTSDFDVVNQTERDVEGTANRDNRGDPAE